MKRIIELFYKGVMILAFFILNQIKKRAPDFFGISLNFLGRRYIKGNSIDCRLGDCVFIPPVIPDTIDRIGIIRIRKKLNIKGKDTFPTWELAVVVYGNCLCFYLNDDLFNRLEFIKRNSIIKD